MFNHSPERAARLKIWKRNRDHTSGADAIKSGRTAYLAKPSYMSPEDYAAHLQRVEYFPAAARTLQSFTGLVFRKPPVFDAPEALKAVSSVMTSNGASIEEFARHAFKEAAITNDGAILVDFPAAQPGLSVADALKLDIRPFLSFYPAESILETRHTVRGGRKVLAYVRLQDNQDQVRELELVAGNYIVTITRREPGTDKIVEQTRSTPLKNGEPLPSLPIVLLNDGATVGALDDLCELNGVHYNANSALTIALVWISAPIVTLMGVKKDVELVHEPGALWRFEEDTVKAEFLEYQGSGAPLLERRLAEIEKHLAWLGSRMLASEKAAAEAAETVARRHASENSILASMARHVSGKIQEALRILADWWLLDSKAVTFVLNTDFAALPVDPGLLAQVTQLYLNGKLPPQAFYEFLIKGEILGEDWTFEAYMDSLETAPIL